MTDKLFESLVNDMKDTINKYNKFKIKSSTRNIIVLKNSLSQLIDITNDVKKHIHLKYECIPAKQRKIASIPECPEIDELILNTFHSDAKLN